MYNLLRQRSLIKFALCCLRRNEMSFASLEELCDSSSEDSSDTSFESVYFEAFEDASSVEAVEDILDEIVSSSVTTVPFYLHVRLLHSNDTLKEDNSVLKESVDKLLTTVTDIEREKESLNVQLSETMEKYVEPL